MLTREFLETTLPDGPALIATAEAGSGLILAPLSEGDIIKTCLEWMARVTESDRFWGRGDKQPAWKEEEDRGGDVYSIKAHGLEYKSSSYYLTAEDWPTGSTCWYVYVECGWREYVGADTPKVAALRAVVVMTTAAQLREIAPRKRPKLMDALAREMQKSKAA